MRMVNSQRLNFLQESLLEPTSTWMARPTTNCYGRTMSMGKRIAREIKNAESENQPDKITT